MAPENLEEEYDGEETAEERWLKHRFVRASNSVSKHAKFRIFKDIFTVGRSIADAVIQQIMERYYIMDSMVREDLFLSEGSNLWFSGGFVGWVHVEYHEARTWISEETALRHASNATILCFVFLVGESVQWCYESGGNCITEQSVI